LNVEAGSTNLLVTDVDYDRVRTGGGKRRSRAERHHHPLILTRGETRGATGLEVNGELVPQHLAVWILNSQTQAMGPVRVVPRDIQAKSDAKPPFLRKLRQLEHVPSAPKHIDLPVDRLTLIG
jgi:hypothetical protein